MLDIDNARLTTWIQIETDSVYHSSIRCECFSVTHIFCLYKIGVIRKFALLDFNIQGPTTIVESLDSQ